MSHSGELLSAYLDGELTKAEELNVVGHLETCTRCQTELGDSHEARAMVRALPILDMPTWVTSGVASSPVELPVRRRPLAWAAAAAAAAFVLVVGFATFVATPPAIEITFTEISNTLRLPASQDGLPPGARAVVIARSSDGIAE